MKKVLLFLDLDDTIFQTKRKNLNGIIPATNPKNPENTSYMTNYQNIFLDLFINSDSVGIIPVTARDFEQYNRTMFSKHHRVNTSAMYFSGAIFENNEPEEKWQKHIKHLYSKLKFDIDRMLKRLEKTVDKETFNLVNVDNYYLVMKNRSKEHYMEKNNELVQILTEMTEDEYFIHANSNNVSIIPKFLDKKYAVEYLIEKYNPELTIGAGDSITDLNFMQICDYKIVPCNSQIEKKIFSIIAEGI